ncbi:MAG TPA: plastocyanin/azurin family copper-binding protein [Gaiellaceae bacterium]|nr:plastocyanin/azurin family copper-binding protein [Gaiellaceae bacterium]
MNRIAMLAAACAAALGASAVASASTPTLAASVSDPLNISLTQHGAKVTHLKAGTYTIVVKDTASDHDFHLTGPGVNKTTSVGGKGTFTWKVTLKPGTYTYVCDPHASFMKGSFTVS